MSAKMENRLVLWWKGNTPFSFVEWDRRKQVREGDLTWMAMGGFVHFRYVDTGDATRALLATKSKVTRAKADALYRAFQEEHPA